MRYLFFGLLFFYSASIINAQQAVDTISYSLGMSIGARYANQGVADLDYNSFVKGIEDMLQKNQTIITKDQSDSINYVYFQSQSERNEKEA